MIRLLLIDDRAVVLAGWRMRLALENDMEVVGEAADLASALRLVKQSRPNVILLDIRLGTDDGLEWIPRLRQADPAAHVVVVTVYDSVENRRKALAQGAAAFVSKELPFDDLLRTVRAVATLSPGF